MLTLIIRLRFKVMKSFVQLHLLTNEDFFAYGEVHPADVQGDGAIELAGETAQGPPPIAGRRTRRPAIRRCLCLMRCSRENIEVAAAAGKSARSG